MFPFGSILDFEMNGSLAYMLSYMDLFIYDFSVPTDPILVNHDGFSRRTQRDGLDITGDKAYVLTEHELIIFDISNPAQSLPMRAMVITQAEDLEVSGSYAYLVRPTAINILDISDPDHPVGINSFHTPGTKNSITGDGDYLYVADGSAGLNIFDPADPAAPTLVSTYDTPVSALNVAVNGRDIFVADGTGGWLHLRASSGKIYLPMLGKPTN